MSRQLISRSPDLQRLQDEGYNLEIRASHLLVNRVPYATAERQVAYGTLVSELTTSGDRTAAPGSHQMYLVGSLPCDQHGNELSKIIHQRGPLPIADDLIACCSFSTKPRGSSYPDYYEKVTAHAMILEGYARALDPNVMARSFAPIATDEDESVFRYHDSATSRARIGAVTARLELPKVVIVGLGGTGSYILDLVAKTPVQQIHLYDGDVLYTHNAFRAPGAAALEELNAAPTKVHYFRDKYDPMHRRIYAHDDPVDESNINELADADFVFLAIDGGPIKKLIIEHLEQFGVPFIDTGLGVYQVGTALGGLLRITSSTEGNRRHVWDKGRISFAEVIDDDYDQNIQIADLNMLTAGLAVIRWKKHVGFYTDFEHEHTSMYTIDGNHLLNEDQAA